jgi:hypothetical protein
MRIQETKIFTFDELSDDAKDKARAWYLEGAFDYDWWQFIYEDAEQIGLKITAFDIDRNTIDGELLAMPIKVCEKIVANYGKTCDTYKLAQEWYREKKRKSPMIGDEFLKRLLEEYLVMPRNEAEFMQSNEQVDESILANGYEFTEDGERA